MSKHIAVNETTYNRLNTLKTHPRASFNEVIEKLIVIAAQPTIKPVESPLKQFIGDKTIGSKLLSQNWVEKETKQEVIVNEE